MTSEEIIKLVLELSGQKGLEDLAEKAKDAAKALTGVKDAATDVEKKTLDLGALASQGKDLFSAFRGGDVAEIIGGITSLVKLVPGLNNFAPVIEKIGDVAAKGFPKLKEWYGYLTEVNKKFADGKKELDEYTKALGEAKIALKDADLAEAREKDEAAGKVPADRQKARGDVLANLIGKNQAGATDDIFQAIQGKDAGKRQEAVKKIEEEYEAALKHIKENVETTQPEPVVRAFRAQASEARRAKLAPIQEAIDAAKAKAKELLAKALTGDAGAMEELQKILPEGSTTRESVRLASPEEQEAQRMAKRDVADQEAQFAQAQKRARDARAAREQVQSRIKSERARHETEMVEGLANEKRIRDFRQQSMEDDIKGVRPRMSPAQQRAMVEKFQHNQQRQAQLPKDPQTMNRRELTEGAQAVQMEEAMGGHNISFQKALKEFRERATENRRLQMEHNLMMQQGSADLARDNAQLSQQLGRGRSAAAVGAPGG